MGAVAERAPRPTDVSPWRRGAGFRPDIEGLRALAIIPVVAYHAAQFAAVSGGPSVLVAVTALFGRVSGGYLGVDVFFVISGFLITGLLVREAEDRDRIHFGPGTPTHASSTGPGTSRATACPTSRRVAPGSAGMVMRAQWLVSLLR